MPTIGTFVVGLSGTRTLPHQIEAVYERMPPQPRLRFLLADDAGVGKRFSQPRPVLVVPLDGSEFAEAALPVAADLARSLNARLVDGRGIRGVVNLSAVRDILDRQLDSDPLVSPGSRAHASRSCC